jgi:hypothetical protein
MSVTRRPQKIERRLYREKFGNYTGESSGKPARQAPPEWPTPAGMRSRFGFNHHC